jgi:hypothetical protein
MKTFIFDGEFEKDIVDELINKIDNCKDKNIEIFFSSTGGETAHSEVLINYINKISKKKKLKFIAFNFIESCAFDFFVNIKNCKKEIFDNCVILAHLSKPYVDGKVVTKVNRVKHKDRSIQELFLKIDRENEKYCKLYRDVGIEEDLVKNIEKGKDVIIPVEMMRKIVNPQKRNKRIEGRYSI